MTGLLTTLGVVAALVVVTLVVLAWRVARRVRRTAVQLTERGRLRLLDLQGQVLPPGPRRDAQALRTRLAQEVAALRQVVDATPGQRVFQQDAGQLLADVRVLAAQLDATLAAAANAPGRDRQRAGLEAVAEQARRLADSCAEARTTLLRTAALDRERALAALQAAVTHETQSLAAYERTDRGLTI